MNVVNNPDAASPKYVYLLVTGLYNLYYLNRITSHKPHWWYVLCLVHENVVFYSNKDLEGNSLKKCLTL